MPENTVTLDDIFALFRESEQQRKEYQQAFEERQRIAAQEMAELRASIAKTEKLFVRHLKV